MYYTKLNKLVQFRHRLNQAQGSCLTREWIKHLGSKCICIHFAECGREYLCGTVIES